MARSASSRRKPAFFPSAMRSVSARRAPLSGCSWPEPSVPTCATHANCLAGSESVRSIHARVMPQLALSRSAPSSPMVPGMGMGSGIGGASERLVVVMPT